MAALSLGKAAASARLAADTILCWPQEAPQALMSRCHAALRTPA